MIKKMATMKKRVTLRVERVPTTLGSMNDKTSIKLIHFDDLSELA